MKILCYIGIHKKVRATMGDRLCLRCGEVWFKNAWHGWLKRSKWEVVNRRLQKKPSRPNDF